MSDSDGKSGVVRIATTVTHPHFGGVRPWYFCPRCSRRASKLYAPVVGVLGCRVCLKLVYKCQYRKESTWTRFLREFWI
jgi:hypothetical protein